MLNETARGVFTIAATPFLPNGALDEESLDRMTDFYMEKGATGLTILGIMGEAGKLSADESATVIARICARASVPVIVEACPDIPDYETFRRMVPGDRYPAALAIARADSGKEHLGQAHKALEDLRYDAARSELDLALRAGESL